MPNLFKCLISLLTYPRFTFSVLFSEIGNRRNKNIPFKQRIKPPRKNTSLDDIIPFTRLNLQRQRQTNRINLKTFIGQHLVAVLWNLLPLIFWKKYKPFIDVLHRIRCHSFPVSSSLRTSPAHFFSSKRIIQNEIIFITSFSVSHWHISRDRFVCYVFLWSIWLFETVCFEDFKAPVFSYARKEAATFSRPSRKNPITKLTESFTNPEIGRRPVKRIII